MRNELILIGAGGHCESIIELIENNNKHKILGILGYPDIHNSSVGKYPVLGHLTESNHIFPRLPHFVNAIGYSTSVTNRVNVYEYVTKIGGLFCSIISKHAIISSRASIYPGVQIFHNAVVGPRTSIDENTILNTGSIIEHNSKVAKHCHISTNSVINGGSHIEEKVLVGSNATVLQGITVRQGCKIGAGAVIIKDTQPNQVYVGVPGLPSY